MLPLDCGLSKELVVVSNGESLRGCETLPHKAGAWVAELRLKKKHIKGEGDAQGQATPVLLKAIQCPCSQLPPARKIVEKVGGAFQNTRNATFPKPKLETVVFIRIPPVRALCGKISMK